MCWADLVTGHRAKHRPPRPVELEAGRSMPRDGIIYKGTTGLMMASGTSAVPRLLPNAKMKTYTLPPKTLERRSGIYGEWFDAVTGGGQKPSEHWPDCAVPLSELVLLGCVAVRTGTYLEWDGPNMRFTNSDDANKLVKPDYQNGWHLV